MGARPGNSNVIRDQAGVGRSTVSLALMGTQDFAQTKQRILTAARALGTSPIDALRVSDLPQSHPRAGVSRHTSPGRHALDGYDWEQGMRKKSRAPRRRK